jgi:ADP-ribose pyrophosphatase YjhB (NUDIX family)
VEASWHEEPWQPPGELERRADEEIAKLRGRGSPAHDGLAARVAGYESGPGGLALELQPVRWALRLVDTPDAMSLTALCLVRSEDGRWLAGRRAAWLATWANRWALGAGGSVEIGENPAETLTRELDEEWQLRPSEMSVEALVLLPTGLVALIGLATVADGAEPVPDAEHDEFAWWPADVATWPEEADDRLRALGAYLSSA